MGRITYLRALSLASAIGAAGGCETMDSATASARASGSSKPEPCVLYVTNEVSGDLTIIDATTYEVLQTVWLGKRPRGIRSSRDGARLFIALSGSPIAPPWIDPSTLPPPDRTADGIGVFDVATSTLARVLRGLSDPEQTAVSTDGRHLYVANEDKGTASVLDIVTGQTLAELEVGGEPEGVTASPDGRVVYVTSEEDNQVAVIDTATRAIVAVVPVGARPRDTAFSPDGRRAYVTSENDAAVSVIDATDHRVVRTIEIEGAQARPMGVLVSPDGARVYVSTGRGGTLVAIDAATGAPIANVKVGARPWGVALHPDGSRVYTANGPSNDVSVVDARTLTVVATIPAGASPWGIVVAGCAATSWRGSSADSRTARPGASASGR